MSEQQDPSGFSRIGAPVFRPLESVDPSRTVNAFPGLQVVGEQDDLLKQSLEVTMMEDWSAYLSARIMAEAARFYTGRINFFRYLPDPVNQQIIMMQAFSEKEYGATEVKHSETEGGASTNLRRPMQALGVTPHPGRNWSFPLVVRTGDDMKEYLAISLKGATTRPAVTRKRGAAGTTGAAQPGAAAAPTGSAPAGNAAPAVATSSPVAATAPVASVGIVPAAGGEIAPAAQPGGGGQGDPAPTGSGQKPARTKSK